MKRIVSLLLTLNFIFMFGCTAKPSENKPENPATEITIVDQLERTVKIKANPQKIVSSYYISTSLLIALDCADKLVGIEAKADTREIYKKSAPHLLNLPAIGSGKGINVEEIAKLEPDVVILPIKLKDSVEQLEKLDIPVIVIDPETMDNFKIAVKIIGKAVGKEDLANELISYFDNILAKAISLTANLENKPKVYLSGSSDVLVTVTNKMYQNDLIKISGGKNVSDVLNDGYWQKISAEELVNYNPDQMLIVSYADYDISSVLNDEKLKSINAIANKNIAVFPSVLEPWDYPTPSSALGILWLTNKLHPQVYTKDEYVKEAKDFYKKYYKIDVSEEDIGL